jgi:hypothetical protein
MDDKGSKKESGREKRTGHHRLGFWLSLVTAVLVVLGMIILTLLPFAMEWGAERVFLRLGAKTAAISDVNFNPMTGHLTVFDLQVEGPNADRVAMEQLVVRMDLFRIFKKRIYFREITLIGFSLDIRQLEDGTLTFAGLSIPGTQEIQESEPEVKKEATPWGLGLKNLDVKELSVHLITPDLDETVVLHHFSLTDFETWKPEKQGDHVLRIGLLGGTVDVEGTVQPFSDPIVLSTRIGIRELSLEQIMPYIKDTPVESMSGSLSGRFSLDTTLSLQPSMAIAATVKFDIFSQDIDLQTVLDGVELGFQPGGLNAGISIVTSMEMGDTPSREVEFNITTSLEGTTSRVISEGTSIEVLQDALSFQAKGSYSDTGTMNLSHLTANAGLSLKGLILKDGNGPAEVVRLGSLDIEGVEINGPDDIHTSLARLRDTELFPRLPGSIGKGEAEQALALKSLEVTGIRLSDRTHLTVDTVQINSLKAWVLREKDGGLEVLRAVEKIVDNKPVEDAETVQVEASDAKNRFTADLKSFTLTGENSLTFRDLSVDPPFNYIVDSLSAEILELSTRDTDLSTNVTFKAGMGKYSSVSVAGTVQPPWDSPDVDMHVELKAIDLPPLTPYTTKYLGYILRSGHLDTEMDILVKKGALNSEANIVVNRIEMDAIKAEDEQRAEERLGIPVTTALSLLKDKNDDIKLTLPVEGDTKDPEFKISDIVVSATGLALQKGVTAYYKDLGATLLTGGLIPPGTFSLLGKLFSGVTTMTFEPVVFDPLAQELSEPGKAYLDLMAEKLESKPKVRLVLCGTVTREDIAALRQADFDAVMAATDSQPPGGTAGVPPGSNPTDPSRETVAPAAAEDSLDNTMEIEGGPVPAAPPSIEEVPLNEDEKERLIEIAKQRALAVKDHLTEIGGLDPGRLFVCYSDVDTEKKDLPPRVDLSI